MCSRLPFLAPFHFSLVPKLELGNEANDEGYEVAGKAVTKCVLQKLARRIDFG